MFLESEPNKNSWGKNYLNLSSWFFVPYLKDPQNGIKCKREDNKVLLRAKKEERLVRFTHLKFLIALCSCPCLYRCNIHSKEQVLSSCNI
jgi:hypothetical protein